MGEYDPRRFQAQADAQNAVFTRIMREQGRGQEPIVPMEDLGLLSDLQRRVIAQRGYGVTNQ
jgi:hypothetical protein